VVKGSCGICELTPTHTGWLLSKTYEVGDGALIRGKGGKETAVEFLSIVSGTMTNVPVAGRSNCANAAASF
jgi:hypothetical protein